MPVGMRQYFVPVWLDVDHRKLKAEIAPDKEVVRTVAEHVSMLPPARNAFLSPFSHLSFSPPPQRRVTATLAFKKLHLLSSKIYDRAIKEL